MCATAIREEGWGNSVKQLHLSQEGLEHQQTEDFKGRPEGRSRGIIMGREALLWKCSQIFPHLS